MASLISRLFGSGGGEPDGNPVFISPDEAKTLVGEGAAFVDVREPSEFASEHVPGSVNAPLSRLQPQSHGKDDQAVVFFCASGARTRMNASRLASAALSKSYVMDGGISAWKRAGFKTER